MRKKTCISKCKQTNKRVKEIEENKNGTFYFSFLLGSILYLSRKTKNENESNKWKIPVYTQCSGHCSHFAHSNGWNRFASDSRIRTRLVLLERKHCPFGFSQKCIAYLIASGQPRAKAKKNKKFKAEPIVDAGACHKMFTAALADEIWRNFSTRLIVHTNERAPNIAQFRHRRFIWLIHNKTCSEPSARARV